MDARRERHGADSLEALFEGASKLIVGRGAKSWELSLGKGADREEIERLALGPTGNLRAPAARVGKTWLVGWSEEAWAGFLGPKTR